MKAGLLSKNRKLQAIVSTTIVWYTGEALLHDFMDSKNIFTTIDRGNCPAFPTKAFFPRTNVVAELSHRILPAPIKTEKNYEIIIGEHGAGKTSLIQKTCEDNTSGIIYLSCPTECSPDKFEKTFCCAIGYSKLYDAGIYRKALKFVDILPNPERLKTSKYPILDIAVPKFLEQMKTYKEIRGKIPVLIIDNINFLCKTEEGMQLLQIMQRNAKIWAVNYIQKGFKFILYYIFLKSSVVFFRTLVK